jgi:UDP-N-acetylmuramoyl-tripeptide--D-alanyl-D-alanine ligase
MLTLADVFEALTNIRPAQADTVVTEAAVDSRQVIPGGLFVALPGEHADGHDYVADAFRRGASFALIQHKVNGNFRTLQLAPDQLPSLHPDEAFSFSPEKDAPICLLVENTLSALQQIARFWRQKLDLSVVGITGSVGKSTTKEVVFEVLTQRYRTLKSGCRSPFLNLAQATSVPCWKWVFMFLVKLPCFAILPARALVW